MAKLSPLTQKVLLVFFGGLTLSLSPSPRQFFKVAKTIAKDWRTIERDELYLKIRSLYKSHLIEGREEKDGRITLIISEKGKKKVLSYKVEQMIVAKPKHWDRKWRLVFFDIPERKRRVRDALRVKLKELNFFELQKSVFVHPFECEDEINFITEFFEVRPFVRFAVVESIDNELHLKKVFKLF